MPKNRGDDSVRRRNVMRQTGELFDQITAARDVIPRTLFLCGEAKSASWQWRVDWPATELSHRGFIADWSLSKDVGAVFPLIEAGRYNVVLTPRAHWNTKEEADNWISTMRSYGLAWVYEIDDDGWSPEIVQRQARLFDNEWRKGEQQLEFERLERIRLIQEADGVVVSSQRLADVARSFTDRPVFCVPNAINAEWFAARQRDARRIVPPLTIGWSGGIRDDIDLTSVAVAWGRIAERYPDVRFVIHGTAPRILSSTVPKDRVTFMGWSSLPDYPRALMNLDIACCAVAPDVEFNAAKTAIKWYEMTLSGAACVVSRTLYGPEVRDGHDALVAETPEEWEAAISHLVEDSLLRHRIRKNARRSVMANHSLESGWMQWAEALAGALDFHRSAGVKLRAA